MLWVEGLAGLSVECPFSVYFCLVCLGFRHTALHMLSKYSITELHAQPSYRKDIMPSEVRLGVQRAGNKQAAFHAGIVT